MSTKIFSTPWCIVLILLSIEFVLSAPQGYNYYSHQQRLNAQRVQAHRLQAQRAQTQNRYRTTRRPNANRVSRADIENAKFLGSGNQEHEDTERTFHLIRKKKQLFNGGGVGNPCYLRNAGQDRAEGRFLWDLNVYNVYPTTFGGGNGCGGYGGGGFGGGGYGGGGFGGGNYGGGGYYGSRPYRGGFFQNFLSLFIPGGALNPNISPNRPFQSSFQSDSIGSNQPQNTQNEPLDYDTSLDGNDGSSNSNSGPTNSGSNSGTLNAPAYTPGQLVGGVATTVNGIIQQLSGNVRPPVYSG